MNSLLFAWALFCALVARPVWADDAPAGSGPAAPPTEVASTPPEAAPTASLAGSSDCLSPPTHPRRWFALGRRLDQIEADVLDLRCQVSALRAELDTRPLADDVASALTVAEDARYEAAELGDRIQLLEQAVGGLGKTQRPESASKQPVPAAPPAPPAPRVRFYHLWSTDCGPCRTELPSVVSVARELEQRGVRIQFHAEERAESVDKAAVFFQEAGGSARWHSRVAASGSPIRAKYGLDRHTQPITVLVVDGRLLWARVGVLRAGDRELLLRCAVAPGAERCQ